jgi:predicted DNA-binding WGR domain protein
VSGSTIGRLTAFLLSAFLLLKQWGRIGTDGCKIVTFTEALAIDALRRQSQIKTRRGYLKGARRSPQRRRVCTIRFSQRQRRA